MVPKYILKILPYICPWAWVFQNSLYNLNNARSSCSSQRLFTIFQSFLFCVILLLLSKVLPFSIEVSCVEGLCRASWSKTVDPELIASKTCFLSKSMPGFRSYLLGWSGLQFWISIDFLSLKFRNLFSSLHCVPTRSPPHPHPHFSPSLRTPGRLKESSVKFYKLPRNKDTILFLLLVD